MGPWRLASPCCENHFNDNGSAPGRCNPLSCEKHFTSANIHNSAMFQEIELWVISWIFESCLINTGFCLSRASPLSLWALYTVQPKSMTSDFLHKKNIWIRNILTALGHLLVAMAAKQTFYNIALNSFQIQPTIEGDMFLGLLQKLHSTPLQKDKCWCPLAQTIVHHRPCQTLTTYFGCFLFCTETNFSDHP